MIILKIVCPIKNGFIHGFNSFYVIAKMCRIDLSRDQNIPRSNPYNAQEHWVLPSAMQSTTTTKDLNGSNCTLINAVIRKKQIYQVQVEWHSKGNKIEHEAKTLATCDQVLILGLLGDKCDSQGLNTRGANHFRHWKYNRLPSKKMFLPFQK